MEKDDRLRAYVDELRDSLEKENVSRIDFDRLKSWLSDISELCRQVDHLNAEMQTLREDLTGRIAGTTKAVAAVERSGAAMQNVLAYLETLPTLGADELISHYRKASARFRDAFPGSFGPLVSRGSHKGEAQDPAVFK